MDLVTHHMLQALVIGRTQEDHNLELLARKPIVHHFISVPLITELVQLRANVVNCLVLERRRITFVTVQRCDLTQNTFNQMTDSHTRRDSVRVNDHVGNEALNRERQILLSVCHTTSTFLTVARGKLVTNLRRFDCSHFYFDKAFIFVVSGEDNLIDVAFFGVLQGNRLVLELLLL